MGKQEVIPDRIQFHNIHYKSILLDLFAKNCLYGNDSYRSDADWKIGKEPEKDLKKIEFNINVDNNKINDMNNEDAVHLKHDLADDNNKDIEDSGFQHKQDDQHNRFCAPVKNRLQPSHQLGGPNEANDWKSTDKYEGELVMAYDTNASNKTLYPRAFYALYIGPNNSGTGHSVFKLSTKQLLTTPK